MTIPSAGYNASGGVTPPALLNSDDYSDFSSLNVDWFLNAASQTIRDYLGWHCAPSLTQTLWVDLCGDGTILLPTRYLTAVTSVTPTWPDAQPISPHAYEWDQRGWINFRNRGLGFAPNAASADLWPIDTGRLFDAYPKRNRRMIVEFTHGWANLPYPVAEVAYELVMRVLEKPAGVAQQVQAGPYKYVFGEFGMVLSENQKARLSHYALPGLR